MLTDLKHITNCMILAMFLGILLLVFHANSKEISRNIAECTVVDFDTFNSDPIEFIGKTICFSATIVKEAGVFKVKGRSVINKKYTDKFDILLTPNRWEEDLLAKFPSSSMVFIRGDVFIDDYFIEKSGGRSKKVKIGAEINLVDHSIYFAMTGSKAIIQNENDYYTYNIHECVEVEIHDVRKNPTLYDGKKICSQDIIFTRSGKVSIGRNNIGENIPYSNDEIIFIEALHDELLYLYRSVTGQQIFFYGVLELDKTCWGIDGEEKHHCTPYEKPIYLKNPEITILLND